MSLARTVCLLCAVLISAGCGQEAPLNVVLITLDTARADHLGCYGHGGIDTPAIDRLASEGVLYERCYTPVPITLPSHLSILTGTYPGFHGVHENAGFYVADELTTLAEVLAGQGYATGAFVGAYPLDSQTGLDQGFDLYDDAYPSSLEQGKHPALRGFFDERPASDVVRPALAWLEEHDRERFFMWAHFFDPHQPHLAPEPFRSRYAQSPYDGEIAYVDEAVGRLLDRLEQLDLLDRTLVVLTADHGEGLGDHGELTHALLLYSTTVRVPLIVRDPRDTSARRVTKTVAAVDIMPTILDRLGLSAPDAVQGDPLPRSDAEPTARRSILSETLYGALLHNWSPLERMTIDDWVYIHGPTPRLYDLASDPEESIDLAADQPERADELRRLLLRRKSELAEGGHETAEQTVSLDKQARLAALGYLGGGSPVELDGLEVNELLPDPHVAIAVFEEMNEGKRLTENGQPALAAAVLEHAKQSDPGNPYLSMYLALAYQQLGDRPSFANELEHLLAVAPEHLGGHLLLANLLADEGDVDGAIDALERALEIDPNNRSTRLHLAHRLEDSGRMSEAESCYRELLDGAPDDVLARNGYATLNYRLGRVDDAVAQLQQVLEAQPFFAPGLLNLAVIRYDQGRIEESRRLVRRALELRPGYGVAHELYAMNLEQVGRQEEAADSWRDAARFAASENARQRALAALAGE